MHIYLKKESPFIAAHASATKSAKYTSDLTAELLC